MKVLECIENECITTIKFSDNRCGKIMKYIQFAKAAAKYLTEKHNKEINWYQIQLHYVSTLRNQIDFFNDRITNATELSVNNALEKLPTIGRYNDVDLFYFVNNVSFKSVYFHKP